jgi:hypothetical protein
MHRSGCTQQIVANRRRSNCHWAHRIITRMPQLKPITIALLLWCMVRQGLLGAESGGIQELVTADKNEHI